MLSYSFYMFYNPLYKSCLSNLHPGYSHEYLNYRFNSHHLISKYSAAEYKGSANLFHEKPEQNPNIAFNLEHKIPKSISYKDLPLWRPLKFGCHPVFLAQLLNLILKLSVGV